MELKKNYKFWFATGSQDLYGDECLSHVAKHAQIIVQNFNESGILPFEVVWKPTLIDSTSIRRAGYRWFQTESEESMLSLQT